MVPDGVIELIQAGVINGERKTLHPHKRSRLLCWVPRRCSISSTITPSSSSTPRRTATTVHDRPERPHGGHQLGHRSGLTGQVCSTPWATRPTAASAGRWIFCAARRAPRAGCRLSPCLDRQERHGLAHRSGAAAGAGVVTSRGDVHYVITEHGVAYLHGKTLRQRVQRSSP